MLRNDFWPVVGITALIVLLRHAADSTLIGIVVGGPLMGGLWLYYLKKIRGEQAGLETVFSSFSIAFLPLFLAGLITMVLTVVGIICLILPGIYLAIAWLFTLALVIDKRLDFWPAMELSRKTISKHWWKFLGFIIILGLINLAGLLACFVGFFVTVPLSLAALMYAYEDIFGAVKSPASASSSLPPIAPTTPPAPQPDRFGRRFAIVLACVVLILVAIAIIGILAAIAIPNFIKGRNHALALRQEQTVLPSVTNPPPASAELWAPPDFDLKAGPDNSNPRERGIDPTTGLPVTSSGTADIDPTTGLPVTSGGTTVIDSVTGLPVGLEASLRKILDEARELTRRHQYEEALQRYIWYHNHALEYDPNQSGVRLSSALSDWIELGRRYPKAKQALIEIRDRKTREFAEGRGYFDLFMDVSNINRELQEDEATYALFMLIRKSDAALAGQCYFAAEDLLVRRGEFELCLSYIGDPQKKFESLRDSWERMTTMDQRMAETYQRFAGTNSPFPHPAPPKHTDQYFVGQTCRLIEILVGANRRAEAEKIRDQAVAILDDSRLKSAVSDAERKTGK